MKKYTEEYLDSLDAFEIFNLWKESDEGKAREKLHAALDDLREDIDIKKSQVCMEFLRLISVFDPSDAEISDIQDIVDKLNGAFNKLRAMKNASKRHSGDPKQMAKQNVHECWELWQKETTRYKSKSAFARDMLNKYESLESQRVIERWCKEWESVPS